MLQKWVPSKQRKLRKGHGDDYDVDEDVLIFSDLSPLFSTFSSAALLNIIIQ